MAGLNNNLAKFAADQKREKSSRTERDMRFTYSIKMGTKMAVDGLCLVVHTL